MKIILIKQVSKLGNPGDIVEVSPGYARNFLIAKGFAKEANLVALQESKNIKEKKEKALYKGEKKKNKFHNVLDGQIILIKSKANEDGHLFGSVGQNEIANAIFERKKIEVDEKNIDLPHNLKQLGKHDVYLKLSGKEKIKFVVEIKAT